MKCASAALLYGPLDNMNVNDNQGDYIVTLEREIQSDASIHDQKLIDAHGTSTVVHACALSVLIMLMTGRDEEQVQIPNQYSHHS